MGNEIKQIRGQLRQIAKELLPDMLTTDMFAKIQHEMLSKLNELAKIVNDRVSAMEQKQKDFHAMLVRQLHSSKPESEPKNEQS